MIKADFVELYTANKIDIIIIKKIKERKKSIRRLDSINWNGLRVFKNKKRELNNENKFNNNKIFLLKLNNI